jgi:hypothetical protein
MQQIRGCWWSVPTPTVHNSRRSGTKAVSLMITF